MTDSDMRQQDMACLFVIFGGTGDLTHRKLLPALYRLEKNGLLPEQFAIVTVGRRDKREAEYRQDAEQSVSRAINKNGSHPVDRQILDILLSRIYYTQIDFDADENCYQPLIEKLEILDKQYDTGGNRLYFLAVAPDYFGVLSNRLQKCGLLDNARGWQRLMIEKPFGSNLPTARELNSIITKSLPESHIFRIDHYLGKEMIQNILALRFGNSLFEPLWNHHYIDNIQITSYETLGVESRGGYYEHSGIRRDMLQNHLLQMLSLIAMEPPVDLDQESIRDEKVKVLRSLRAIDEQSSTRTIVRGQYGPGQVNGTAVKGYREEERVSPESETDTFIALKAHVDNFRWAGVPFYIRAGKRMDHQSTRIVIEFKKLPGIEFFSDFKNQNPNLLVVEIQPNEGLFFQINAKRPGNTFAMERINLNFSQSAQVQSNSPEAYERLILEAMRDNQSLFTRWDELECSWQFVDSIENILSARPVDFPNYAAGSTGPEAAKRLTKADGREWWEL